MHFFQKMKNSLIIASILLCTQASISDYISKADIEKFLPAFKSTFENFNEEDLSNVYYGAKGFTLLSQPLPANAGDACKHLQKFFKDDSNTEIIFHSLASWSLINCNKILNTKLHKDTTLKALKTILEKQESTTGDIRYALESLSILSEPVPNAIKIVQLLQAQLKEDDTLPSGAGQFATQYVEDVVVQADEVDGRIMQWEGGLTLTSLLLTGLLRLPETKPLTQVQAEKFATYLLTRKTVQNAKGVVCLLEAAFALAKSNVSPVSITFVDFAQNLLSLHLHPVIAQSATRTTDDVVVLSKQPLTAGATPTEFILPLLLDPGHYRLDWVTQTGTSAPRLTKLQHPSKLTSNLQADSSHHLILRFSLSRPVQQPFLRLSSGKREIIFVAELDSSKAYKIDVNLANELSYSAQFDLELILGDSIMSNPLRWSFGSIDVALASQELAEQQAKRGPRPEIVHMFRPAEKRPPHVVSMLFTGLAASPILLLLILWIKVGINFKNFSFAALPFHIGLGGIFALFICFWLKLDMFTTCAWLIPIGGFTFLAGHHILSKLAKQKK
ncbi:hypothetical protein RI129_005401 [Pyrocoelia pectoralis]|uniref:Dolichyl-diphosphooligosaccharide--protein glycosyltransferase subunit 2 n=1 Tax=Pyrocoelia pectoralis TaxID=417401 RepID=A0AAN7ZKC8_9COLE